MAVTLADPIKRLLATFLPPVAVFLEVGLTGYWWLNILLTPQGISRGSSTRSTMRSTLLSNVKEH